MKIHTSLLKVNITQNLGLKRKYGKSGLRKTHVNLIPSPLVSSLHPAFSAVNWPAGVWNKWNVTFLTTVRANCLMHFPT